MSKNSVFWGYFDDDFDDDFDRNSKSGRKRICFDFLSNYTRKFFAFVYGNPRASEKGNFIILYEL